MPYYAAVRGHSAAPEQRPGLLAFPDSAGCWWVFAAAELPDRRPGEDDAGYYSRCKGAFADASCRAHSPLHAAARTEAEHVLDLFIWQCDADELPGKIAAVSPRPPAREPEDWESVCRRACGVELAAPPAN